jgi:YD repeat-containing protein
MRHASTNTRSRFFLCLEIGTVLLVLALTVIYRGEVFDSPRPKTLTKLPGYVLSDVPSPRWNGDYPCVFVDVSSNSEPKIGRCATPAPMSDADRRPVDRFETDLRRGKFILRQTDLSLKEAGFEIPLTRTYTSDDSLPQNKVHAFGLNANHPYDIAPLGTRNPYTEQFIALEDGDFLYFPRVSPGTSYADAIFRQVESGNSFYKAVTRWDGSEWVTQLQDGSTIRFPESHDAKSLAEGAPTEMIDKEGHKIELIRDWHRNLREIRGPDGAWVKLDYDDRNRIVRAEDNRGKWVTYTYDSVGYLMSAVHSDGTARSYSYEAGALVSVHDQQHRLLLQNTFYPRSTWLSKQQFGNGDTIEYDYTLSPNAEYAMKATLTMRDYSQKTVEIGDCISDAYKRISKGGDPQNTAPSGSHSPANQTTAPTSLSSQAD